MKSEYKIIIVEGLDNVGKDFVINKIKNILQEGNDWQTSFLDIHCVKPGYSKCANNSIAKLNYAVLKYCGDLNNSISMFNQIDYIIYNRSFVGEYIYGPLYHNIEKDNFKNYFDRIFEGAHLNYYNNINNNINDKILYIQLNAPAQWLARQEDGFSQSNGKIDDIKKEQELYKEAFSELPFKNKFIVNTTIKDILTKQTKWKSDEELEYELRQIL